METEDFLNLDVKQVREWVSSDDIIVSTEEEVFKGIVKWVSHKKSERDGDFPELLHEVRLTSVSHDFVLNELMREELFTKDTEFCLNFVVDAMKFMMSADNERVNQQPRRSLETHTDGIFVCGGKKALCYFPQQNVWYRLADTPSDHNNHCLAQYKSKIYIVGGQAPKLGESVVMEFYVPSTNSWGAIPRHGSEHNFHCCTVLKGALYAIALLRFWDTSGIIYRYDTEMNSWGKMKDTPSIQENPCLVTNERHLYIIGGRSGQNNVLTTRRFDPSNNRWEEVADINEARYDAFGVAMGGKIFIAGGKQSLNKVISSCEVYDPSTDEWQLMPSLNVPRYGASMVCCKGRLYVVGGTVYRWKDNGFSRAITVEEFDSEENEWTEKSAIPVKSCETPEEQKKNNTFHACFARLYKQVIEQLDPLK